MAEVASVFQTKRIGKETVPGTLVAANKLLQSVGFMATVKPEIEEFTPDGAKATALTIFVREITEIKVSGKPTYDELTYVFAMFFGDGTKTNPSGTAYKRVWAMNNRGIDPFLTFTLDFGYDQYWYRAGNMFLKDMSLKIDNKGITLDGTGMAKTLSMDYNTSSTSAAYTYTMAASGGTFTMTVGAGTTSAVAATATAATLQTALEALSTVGVGNVAVSKTGNVFTIGFINTLGDVAVTLTANGASLTGGTATLASTQTGAAPTILPLKPLMVTHFDIYLEDTYAALTGATPISRGFSYEFSISDKLDVVKPIRSTVTSFDGTVETKPKVAAKLTMAADNVGRAMLTTMRNSGVKYLRIKGVGGSGYTISGSEKYMFQIDCAVQIMDLSGPEDSEGIFALNWDFAVIDDASLPGGFQITLENAVNTL